MPPFVEVGGVVFAVVGWEPPDMPERKRYELRRLPPDEEARYRWLKRKVKSSCGRTCECYARRWGRSTGPFLLTG
jgi:hypothetical protein